MANPNSMMFIADADTRRSSTKRINGKRVRLVAIQESTRTRKKRTVYVYHIEGSQTIVYNRSRNGIMFMRMALKPENISRYYKIFAQPPVTPAEQAWLDRYGYVLQ